MPSELAEPEVSRHKCLIYEGDPGGQLPVVVPLLLEGLRDGWRCLYLGEPRVVELVRDGLARRGVDILLETARGALLLSSDRGHLEGGGFDPRGMVAMLRTMIDEAVRDGYRGLCASGDMTWELGEERNFEKLLEYEALLERVFREKPLMGICQYRRDAVPAKAVSDALLAHRSVFIGEELNRDNLFYVPPEILLEESERDRRGDWMCGQITRVLKAERERDRALEEQRRLSERLAEANRDLERRVGERTADLEAFNSSVSHDLRAPVRAVAGFARLISDSQGERLDPEGRRRLTHIIDSADRMGHLIDDLLEFSRAGLGDLRAATVDIAGMAREVVVELTGAGAKGEVEIGPVPLATGDPSLLRQVLLNLLGNAFKYSSRRPDPKVEVGGSREQGELLFWVKDNGAGFDMARAEGLFGIFQRLHSRDEFDGTGVGLALVKRIVERHGGRIWAESAPGRGATFRFTLPERRG